MTSPTVRACAACLILDPTGRVLLGRQAYGHRLWGLPGGVVDPGETPVTAAIREAREEVGVDVTVDALVGMYLLHGGDWPDVLAHVFLARLECGSPHVVDGVEIERVEWRALTDLPSPLLPDAEAALQDWARGRRGVVREVQRQVALPAWTAP